MFKNSLELWCFFGVGGSAFTLPALARTASLCAAFKRERERERERERKRETGTQRSKYP